MTNRTNAATTPPPPARMEDHYPLRTQLKAIRSALSATGDPTLPKPLADATAFMDKVAEAKRSATDRTTILDPFRMADPASFDTAFNKATAAWADLFMRTAVLDGLTDGDLYGRVAAEIAASIDEIIERLRPLFVTAAADLTSAALDLPGDDPLGDASAVLAAGAGDNWTTAGHAADTLLAISGALASRKTRDQLGGVVPHALAPLLPLVDTPDLPMERIAFNGHSVEPEDMVARYAAVRGYVGSVVNGNARTTLVRVARGDFADVTLDLAATADEITERIARIDTAHRQRNVRPDDTRRSRDSVMLLPL